MKGTRGGVQRGVGRGTGRELGSDGRGESCEGVHLCLPTAPRLVTAACYRELNEKMKVRFAVEVLLHWSH